MSHSIAPIGQLHSSTGEHGFTTSCSCGAAFCEIDVDALNQSVEQHKLPKQGKERADAQERRPMNGAE